MDKVVDINGVKLSIGSVLIIGAELMHEFVDAGNEAEASTVTTLKSSGKKYKATLIVTEAKE